MVSTTALNQSFTVCKICKFGNGWSLVYQNSVKFGCAELSEHAHWTVSSYSVIYAL